MLDLFSIAENNVNTLRSVCNDSVINLADEHIVKIKEFKCWVENETLISININPFVFAELLNGAPFKNIHEIAHEDATITGIEKDEWLRKKLGKYYNKRMVFDKTFQYGENFKYGALNGGCCGLLSYFGKYCAVLAPNYHQTLDKCVCLLGDSLEVYFTGNENYFNYSSLCGQAIPYSYRHYLAAQQRINNIVDNPAIMWKQLLISDVRKSYFEVIFVGAPTITDFQCIRITKEHEDLMDDLIDKITGKRDTLLSDDEEVEVRIMLEDYRLLKYAEKEKIIKLVVLI